ncbi:(E3-independent) E2 ubiquitin-conjugating enzyme-like [Haliotis rufescens]|uniref:(E3-independent) E2 ubiquitin-conjugating enzyme-like n=1 Tax=Haliotis rufescens TaxID=6454 RepID=UPI00201E9D71|nr:(E3-independent) E2 ubiquitin-conjugating enzyme-like [Haliotis rufescens]
MAACTIFEEDEVCLVTPEKGYIYGLVLENSEFLSSDEESDDLPGQIKNGTVRVAWHPDGKETVVQEDKVILVDRSLMPGDVVRRLILNEDSQRGYVKDMNVTCHLHILGTDKYIYNIDSKSLDPITEFDTDPGEVTLDSWVGRIETVNEDVTLLFPDGARCVISDSDICVFEDALEKRGRHTEFCNCNTYPGRELHATMHDLCDVKWLQETPMYNDSMIDSKPRMTINVVVESVVTKSVEVHWLCRGFSKVANPLAKLSPPERIVQGEDLKRLRPLDWFAHCSVQIGDKAYYTIKDTDTLETSPPKRMFVPPVISKMSPKEVDECCTEKVFKAKSGDAEKSEDSVDKAEEADPAAEQEAVEPVTNGEVTENDEDYEDVVDDDGSDAGSQASGHSNSASGAKKKKTSRKGPHLATKSLKKVRGRRAKQKLLLPQRVVNIGDKVAVEICYTYTMASVVWQDGTEEEDIPSPELYPIHHLDELEYFPGDYVVDAKDVTGGNQYGLVVSCDHRERTCLTQWMKPYEVGKSNRPMEYGEQKEVSVYDIKDHPDYKFRPGHSVIRVGGFEDREQKLHAVGQVHRLDPGNGISVKWPDGSVSSCYPQELYIVNDDPSDYGSSEWETSSSSGSESGTDTSWETENEEELMDADDTMYSEGANKSFFMLCTHKKTELDTLLVRAQTALSKLESLFQGLDQNLPNVSTCYHDILRIYKICKDLDKILKSNFFEEEEITDLISAVRLEIKCEKSRKLAKHLEQMFQSWHHGLSDHSKDEGQGDEEDLDHSTAEDSRSLPGEIERNICVSEEELVKNLQNKECSKKGDEDSNTSNDSGTEVSASLNSEPICDRASAQGDNAAVDVSARPGTEAAQNGASVSAAGDNDAKKDSNPDPVSTQNAKELCLKICRRLHILMAKIQEEVNLRWKKCESTQTDPIATQTDPAAIETASQLSQGDVDSPDVDGKIITPSSHPCKVDASTGEDNSKEEDMGEAEPCCDKVRDSDSQTDVTEEPSCKTPSCVKLKETGFTLAEEVEKSEEANSSAPTKGFQMESEVLASQKFRSQEHAATDQRGFMTAVRKELKLLRTSLPDGIVVKGFEERLDLYSVMIIGPAQTPYEDGLFFFDVQLPNDYPNSPPIFHYHSYCSDRLNPNLYEDGKVCVSLLGTWSGKGNEVWTSSSNLLQVLVSIQGLILVGEPYYNEAGYERQRGTQQGLENSRMYNEMAILKLIQSLTSMVRYPPELFRLECHSHLRSQGLRMIRRLETWLHHGSASENPPTPTNQTNGGECSDQKPSEGNDRDNSIPPANASAESKTNDKTSVQDQGEITQPSTATGDGSTKDSSKPDFPLLPASKGFRLSLQSHLDQFRKSLDVLQTDKV